MVPALQRVREEFLRQRLKLAEHLVEPAVLNCVLPVRRRGHGCEAHLAEANLLGEVTKNSLSVQRLRRQCHTGADWLSRVTPQQFPDLRHRHVVAARTAVKNAELVLHILRTVDRNRDGDVILDQEVNDVWLEQRPVRRQIELDPLTDLGCALPCVGNRDPKNGHVQ